MKRSGPAKSGHAILLLAVAALAGAACLGQNKPDDAALAKTFLALGRESFQRNDATRAIEALRRAVELDGSLAEAQFLLGKLARTNGTRREAMDALQATVRLAAGPAKADPKAAEWSAEAAKYLDELLAHQRLWEKLRAEHAAKFTEAALKRAGLPSCVRGLEIAQRLCPTDPSIARELPAARKLLPEALPPAAEKPDAGGAKLLAEKAENLTRSGQQAEAQKLLTDAARLSRDPHILLALAEGYITAEKDARAAVVLAETAPLIDEAPKGRQAALRAQLARLRDRADPGQAEIDALIDGFADAAEALARKAVDAGDAETGESALTAVVELAPQRASAQKLLKELRKGAGVAFDRKPRLDAEEVAVTSQGARVSQKVTAESVEFRGTTTSEDRRWLAVGVNVRQLTWGKQLKASWRVEQAAPSPDTTPDTLVGGAISPISGLEICARADSTDRAWKLADLPAGVKVRTVMPDAELRKLFDKDGAYTIAFEKNDRLVSLRVNGRAVVEVELTDRQAAEAAGRDVVFKLFGSAPPYRNVLVRATLTDFSCSGDCIRKK